MNVSVWNARAVPRPPSPTIQPLREAALSRVSPVAPTGPELAAWQYRGAGTRSLQRRQVCRTCEESGGLATIDEVDARRLRVEVPRRRSGQRARHVPTETRL